MSTLTEEALVAAVRAAEQVVEERVGLRPSAATELRLASSLVRRAEARRVGLDDYVALIGSDPTERQALVDLVTVQETSWFRDGAQIDALVRRVVPAAGDGPVVVWSAGCATGQEPWSLAIALHEAGVRDWRVVGSDVSAHACARARAGRYRDAELRGLSAARAGRYLHRVDGGWAVVPELRERVAIVHQNVATDAPPVGRGECTAVLCRNVFIYLSRDRVLASLERFHDRLRPGGVLFLGASETLAADPRFVAERVGDVFAYRRAVPTPPPADRPVGTGGSPAPGGRPGATAAPSPATRGRIDLRGPALPGGAELRAAGEVAAGRSDHAAAATSFRHAVYVDPDDVAAHLGLGFSLEALGHAEASHRAFAAAKAALDRADATVLHAALEGYGADTVRVVLACKLAGPAERPTGVAP